MKATKMYKTVRHGENSLQYKILAQQEEGMAHVKCKRSARAVTVKFITVIVLLVCGVIASAVLVPMILTNDFVTLTGTFQKFSVSTLRRSHSGNHVVVIAKKPYGWNSSRSIGSQGARSSDSQNHLSEGKKVSEVTPATHPNGVPASAPSTARGGRTTPKQSVPEANTLPTKSAGEEATTKSSAAESVSQGQKNSLSLDTSTSTSKPLWFGGRHKWNLQTPATFVTWLKNGTFSNPLSTTGGIIFAVVFIIILLLILKRSLPRRRTSAEKESAEAKEDKTRLLKPSVRGSDEE